MQDVLFIHAACKQMLDDDVYIDMEINIPADTVYIDIDICIPADTVYIDMEIYIPAETVYMELEKRLGREKQRDTR